MKIPYGVSNFSDIQQRGLFYADKTPFLPILERDESGYHYLVFLRPRRMGKSLFLSLLEHYYDLGRAEQFDALFRGLWIHDNPTPERNTYLVLSFDFSQVGADGGQEALRLSFLEVTKSSVHRFILKYRDRVPELGRLLDHLEEYQSAEALLSRVMTIADASGHKLYVLIDEYDNFANRLLAEGAQDLYASVATRTGFVRTFYATLKAGTTSGAVGRLFITGVSPLLLDDLSSGFNIASHVSQDPALNTLAGFTHADVERAVNELLFARPELARETLFADRGRLLRVLEQYYDGYRFSPQATERVFNADMVLYFLSEADRKREYPTDMLDLNVRTDYQRLQRIGVLSGAAADERRTLLEAILADGGIESALMRQFGVGTLSAQTQFISLLYYLGMLTLGPQPADRPAGAFGYRLEIPNRVIRELQWEHLATLLKEQAHLTIDTRDLEAALQAMATLGEITPFLALFHERVVKAVGLKDLRRLDEKALKLMLLAFISLSKLFYPLSEKEFAQGYCDLFLGASPLYPETKFAWLLELKYLPAGAKGPQIEAAFAQAAEQVARYAGDARLVPLLTQGRALKAGMLVFVGARKVLFRPWEEGSVPASTGSPKPARAGKQTGKKQKRGSPA